jgi:hypothetical protein
MKKKFVFWLARVFKVELEPFEKKVVIEHVTLDFVELTTQSVVNRFDMEKLRIGDNRALVAVHREAISELWDELIKRNFIEMKAVDDVISRETKFLYKLRVAQKPEIK